MFNDIVIETVRRCGSQLDLRSIELGYFDLRDIPSRINAIEQIIRKLKYQPADKRATIVKKLSQHGGVTLPTDLMMSDTQVRHLNNQGVEIGAHTMNHPILTSTEASMANSEIRQSKAYLESLLNKTVTSFAYPNGRPHQDYAREHVQMVKDAGFEIALSTAWGTASKDADLLQIPRLAPWDSSTWKYALRILRGYRQRSFITV
jgi:peptidoglycan/xylan/chitin deacetylase (PgdA/CDA1 family)